jgi:hypothetical protein
MHSAVEDTKSGRYEDALQKFLWFHEASRHETGMGGVRLSFALGYWMDLASRYPPALDSFIALRDNMEGRRLANEGDFESFHDVFSLNQHLNADERTIDLFMQIAQIAPSKAQSLYPLVERLLVSDGKYHACAPYLEWQARVDTSILAYELGLEHEASWDEDAVCPPKFARRHFRDKIATLVALLVLNDRKEEAIKVCDRCLDVLDDEEFRNTLRIALAGHFPADEDGRAKR